MLRLGQGIEPEEEDELEKIDKELECSACHKIWYVSTLVYHEGVCPDCGNKIL